MARSISKRTVEEMFRAQGIDPKLVKFGRLVGPGSNDPFRMTVEEFSRAAIGGRALDSADNNFAGFEQQFERACRPIADEASLRDLIRNRVDLELALVFLVRLRRAAVLIRRHVPGGAALGPGIGAFDAAVPDLTHLRDTEEHFDDYVLGKGRHKPKAGMGRQHTYPPNAAPIIARGERRVDLGVAMRAARELYQEIYRVTVGRSPHLLAAE